MKSILNYECSKKEIQNFKRLEREIGWLIHDFQDNYIQKRILFFLASEDKWFKKLELIQFSETDAEYICLGLQEFFDAYYDGKYNFTFEIDFLTDTITIYGEENE